jgi:glycosyltransferase involved in cell wall biosynthesis
MIAKEEGALVLSQSTGGLGTAFRQGIEEGLKLDADALAHIDADMQYDPNQMRLLVQPIIEGKADMVLGKRIIQYRMPRIKRMGNQLFSLLVSTLSGAKISDAQTGYRVLSKRAMRTLLSIRGDHTYTQESILVASKRGLRIKEIPITFKKRDHGRSFINLVRYPIQVLVILITAYVRER